MKRRTSAILLTASLLAVITTLAQAQPETRASGMREFTPAFWQTMPKVSPLCRAIVDESMYAIAGQLRDWKAYAYNDVVFNIQIMLKDEPVTTDRDVISQLDWLECRDLVLWGINNRKLTPQELAGLKAIEEEKVAAARREAEYEMQRESCESTTGSFWDYGALTCKRY